MAICNLKTLDAKHNKIMSNFTEDETSISNLKITLDKKKEEMKLYTKKKKTDLNDNDFKNYYILKDEIIKLNKKYNDIVSRDEVNNYYLKNLNILHDYYSAKDKIANNESFKSNVSDNLQYFNKKKIFDNKSLLDDYLQNTDNNYITNKKKKINLNICVRCLTEMLMYNIEGIMVCDGCGKVEYITLDSYKPSYRDPPPEISYFAYKRINHFNEWLCQFQGKETTEISEDVYDKILLEIKKERILDMNKITPVKIRQYLKKLKLNKYYEHTTHIINRLNGSSLPIIDKNVENQLRRMFKDIQEPFIRVCPKNRKNFLSYSYVLHKFVELLKMNELKQYFPLLKSREKLHQQDLIWKDMCKILDWPFYKSI